MRASRLLQTTIACVGLAVGSAYASESITVNYDALDRLPPRSSASNLIAPKLTPPGLVRHRAIPSRTAAAVGNAPLDVGTSVPPIFERSGVLYNNLETGAEASSGAFGDHVRLAAVAPRAMGVTGASTRGISSAQATAMLTAPAFAPSASVHAEIDPWSKATRVGAVLFQNNGYDVLDLDRSSLNELDRLAHRIGNAQQRILLRAFGGGAGDESHEAHRMALKRGLAVRRYLIARGVSSTLIDVTAVGGATDGGPLDRVDVVAASG